MSTYFNQALSTFRSYNPLAQVQDRNSFTRDLQSRFGDKAQTMASFIDRNNDGWINGAERAAFRKAADVLGNNDGRTTNDELSALGLAAQSPHSGYQKMYLVGNLMRNYLADGGRNLLGSTYMNEASNWVNTIAANHQNYTLGFAASLFKELNPTMFTGPGANHKLDQYTKLIDENNDGVFSVAEQAKFNRYIDSTTRGASKTGNGNGKADSAEIQNFRNDWNNSSQSLRDYWTHQYRQNNF